MWHIGFMIDKMCRLCDILRKFGFGCVWGIAMCSLMLSCSSNRQITYRVTECTPAVIYGDVSDNVIEVSPKINDSINKNINLELVAVRAYNLHEFFSSELDSFTHSGLKVEEWSALCYEEGITYEEYCTRCAQFNEAVDAEAYYLHDLFYKKTGVEIVKQLENGFCEANLTMGQLLTLLQLDGDKPSMFICTIDEYQTYFSSPVAQPS